MLTREEDDLLKRLAPAPKCIHDHKYVQSVEKDGAEYWFCTKCDMFTRKGKWGEIPIEGGIVYERK